MYFYVVSSNFSLFISNFINLKPLPFFLMSLVKGLLILLIFSKNQLFFFFFFFFLEPYPQHLEVPGLRVKSELQLPADTTAIAVWDPSRVCSLHYSSRQCQLLNPLSMARDQTCILMDTRRKKWGFITAEQQWELYHFWGFCWVAITAACRSSSVRDWTQAQQWQHWTLNA